MATNKASGLTARNTSSLRKASELFERAEGNKYEAWFHVYEDFVASGVKSPATYAEALKNNDNVTTKMPVAQTEKVLSAIRRCVGKYGTIAKVKTEHAKWCKDNGIMYVDITSLKVFAPEGQRAKGVGVKVTPAVAVTLTRVEASKRLAKLPKAMRDEVIAMLGLK